MAVTPYMLTTRHDKSDKVALAARQGNRVKNGGLIVATERKAKLVPGNQKMVTPLLASRVKSSYVAKRRISWLSFLADCRV
jgi:hypothetical protein